MAEFLYWITWDCLSNKLTSECICYRTLYSVTHLLLPFSQSPWTPPLIQKLSQMHIAQTLNYKSKILQSSTLGQIDKSAIHCWPGRDADEAASFQKTSTFCKHTPDTHKNAWQQLASALVKPLPDSPLSGPINTLVGWMNTAMCLFMKCYSVYLFSPILLIFHKERRPIIIITD